MGYTHYWRRERDLDATKFAAAVEDCRKLCAAIPIPLGDYSGEGEPEFSAEAISFNGHRESGSFARAEGLAWPTDKAQSVATIGQEATAGHWFAGVMLSSRAVGPDGDGSYESFCVERNVEPYAHDDRNGRYLFGCCKTNYRPYDLLVQCCLIVLKEHLGDAIIVTSDGDQQQWNEAADGCQIYLGYGLMFELDSRTKAKAADSATV